MVLDRSDLDELEELLWTSVVADPIFFLAILLSFTVSYSLLCLVLV